MSDLENFNFNIMSISMCTRFLKMYQHRKNMYYVKETGVLNIMPQILIISFFELGI